MKSATLLIVLLLTLGLSAKHPQPVPAGVSLDPRAWDVRYSSGMPSHPSALVGMAGWWLPFPSATGSLNYLTVPYTTPIAQGKTVSASVQIVVTSGEPDFVPLYPCQAGEDAAVRLYLEQKAPKHAPDATYAGPTYRWWSNPVRLVLAPGAAIMSAVVQPDQWSDADGHFATDALSGFADALAHPAAVGFTFGSCFFGHGVDVLNGSARFILTSYTIQ